MAIKGITNTTLNDYPGKVAATIFMGGCDFRCPYCHNKSLVIKPEKLPSIRESEVLDFLAKRKVALEGVCITGGEPLKQRDLGEFLKKVKDMGYKVKLDTNGYNPTHLLHLMRDGLVDYISMDIKNSPTNYERTAGCPDFELSNIRLSVDLIKDSGIDYEFRTTVVRELHTRQDIEDIGLWLQGSRAYYIQPYVESEDVIIPVFSSYDKKQMEEFVDMLRKYIPNTGLRGYEL